MNYLRKMGVSGVVTRVLAIGVVSLLVLALVPPGFAQPDFARREHLLRILPKLSGHVMLRLAERIGVTDIQGKAILRPERGQDRPPDAPTADNVVSGGSSPYENEPSIALNPTDPNIVVAGMHYHPADDRCALFRSVDGGASWSGPTFMPLVISTDFCSDPVVRWSPNGATAYFAYMSIRGDQSTADIVVSRSTDGGATWTGPVVAIPGTAPDFPDKPWLGVHTFDSTQPGRVYVTTTNFRGTGDCDIVFTSSNDSATTFALSTTLATSSLCDPVVLQGSNVVGGTGGEVLVCWYNSRSDGWLVGAFDIRCRRSGNNGGSWGGEVTAINGITFELPYWMCPNLSYYRLWGAMFPQVRIAPNGSAHIVVTRDPTSGSSNGECGNVVYARSDASPYSSWTAPVTISTGSNTDKTAQNYATLTIEVRSGSPAYALHALWVDQRLSPRQRPNRRYDVYRSISTNGGGSWSSNVRVTSASSLTDYTFIGDYIDGTSTVSTTSIRTNFAWTDRRDKTSIFDQEDDVWHGSVP